MELLIPILWTIVFGIDLGYMIMGHPPTWSLVFLPLITLLIEEWIQFFDNDDFL